MDFPFRFTSPIRRAMHGLLFGTVPGNLMEKNVGGSVKRFLAPNPDIMLLIGPNCSAYFLYVQLHGQPCVPNYKKYTPLL